MGLLNLECLHTSPGHIRFVIGEVELLRLEGNGDIFVKGVKTDNNIEVVNGLKELINASLTQAAS